MRNYLRRGLAPRGAGRSTIHSNHPAMLTDVVTHDRELFMWHKEDKALTSEISMLDQGGRRKPWSRLYSDALDEGFAIQGKHGTAVFFLDAVQRDGEGDVQFWTFRPTGETLKRLPCCYGMRVTVFND